MPEYRRCCLLLLAALLAGLSLGKVNITKSGCLGDSIELFENITIDSDSTACSLYAGRKKDSLIVVWSMQNSVVNPTFVNGYSEKFFLDKFGNIWIRDLHDSDSLDYFIKCTKGNSNRRNDVKLDVLVPPETSCKPKIIKGDDSLTTYLEGNDCGKPVAYAYWLEQPGISVERNKIKLPRKEGTTFYACIEGPAVRCAKSSKLSDYCTVFIDERRTDAKLSESWGVTMGIIICGINLLVIIILLMYIICTQKKKLTLIHSELQHLLSSRTEDAFPFSLDHGTSIDTGLGS